MFSKMLNFLVDDLILNKKSPSSKGNAQINYNNPLIYSDRPKKTHKDYAKHMMHKIRKSHRKPNSSPLDMTGIKNLARIMQKSTRTKLLFFFLLTTSVSFIFFRHQFFILLFILVGAISRVTQKYFPLIIGLDFCLFFAIIVSIAYTPTLGMLTGIISSLIGSFFRQIERVEYYFTPIYGFIPVWIIMSLAIIPQASLLLTGMICVAVYIIARFIMISLTYQICIANQITYISTTLVFNYWLFSSVAPFLVKIMI
ncbi:MAG: hypothetical protein ABIG84_08555 [archaeon]